MGARQGVPATGDSSTASGTMVYALSARDAGWMFDCQRGGVQVSPATAYPPGYGLMVNVCGPDVPPPVGGLKTVTLADPAVVMSVAGTAAWICVA